MRVYQFRHRRPGAGDDSDDGAASAGRVGGDGRGEPAPDEFVDELIVNGAFAMDSAETSSERALGRLPFPFSGARVLLGGLGLGYTANELLEADVALPVARERSTCQAPSQSSLSTDRAASRASRLLPTPGGPVSVTMRCSRRSSIT